MNIQRYIIIVENKAPDYENIEEVVFNGSVTDIQNAGVKPKQEEDTDTNYVDHYELTPDQLEKIQPLLEKPVQPDFAKYLYVLSCEQV